MKAIGIYIHIPFCLRKCNYCDFCSYTSRSNDFEKYAYGISRRIKKFAEIYGKRNADTVYFGGGTPTLLPDSCFETIFDAIKNNFYVQDDAEITVECNPATATFESLSFLRAIGVNRLSVGVQSANDNELSLLGRLHSFKDFCISYELARRANFENISVDLMYGIPDQTIESFLYTLRRVSEMNPEHISAYGLKIEPETPFGRNPLLLNLPDEDTEYEMYRLCREYLESDGYFRYEISNFAKPGYESKHNLKYWQLKEYIGFGVAAHSFIDGKRFGNSTDIDAFLRGEDIISENSLVSKNESVKEYVMLGLRLESGISANKYKDMTGRDIFHDKPILKKLEKNGLIVCNGDRIALTDHGFFVSNAVLTELLD